VYSRDTGRGNSREGGGDWARAQCARDREALRRAGVSCVLNCAAECRNHSESDLSYTLLQLKVPTPTCNT
jgi:hypothetical protein